jgi:hypothetical protein
MDDAIQPEEWQPYKAWRSFNLYELACLLHRVSPERLASAITRERIARIRAVEGREPTKEDLGNVLELINVIPEMMLGDTIGGTLKTLKTATAAPHIRVPVEVAEARRLTSAMGLTWPAELETPTTNRKAA